MPKTNDKKLSGFLSDDLVALRVLHEGMDHTEYFEFINDTANLKWVEGAGIFPITPAALAEYVNTPDSLLLGVFNEAGNHVGNIHLSFVNLIHRSAQFGCDMIAATPRRPANLSLDTLSRCSICTGYS